MRGPFLLQILLFIGPVYSRCPVENKFDSSDGVVVWTATINGDTDGTFVTPGGVNDLDMQTNTIDLQTEFPAEIMRISEVILETRNVMEVTLENNGKSRKVKSPEWVSTRIRVKNFAVNELTLKLVKGEGEAAVRKLIVKGCVHVVWCTWEQWGPCSATCGKAERDRTRGCGCQSPMDDVFICKGKSLQQGTCPMVPCFSPVAQAIADSVQQFNDVWPKLDDEEITNMFYTEDSLMVPLDKKEVRGLKDILEQVISELKRDFPVIETTLIEAVGLSEDTAFSYNLTDFFNPDGSYNQTRRFFVFWKKVDKTWYALKVMSNME